jgi:uncharacterized iron-regulated membrane protein
MTGTSTILIVSGLLCLGLCGFAFYKLRPQAGQESRWLDTDTFGTAIALGLLVLMLAGVSMIVKGIFL